LFNVCFVLFVISVVLFDSVFSHWGYDPSGPRHSDDFVNVGAGRPGLDGHPALAYDGHSRSRSKSPTWPSFFGHFAWHYPPPFLSCGFLAQFPTGCLIG